MNENDQISGDDQVEFPWIGKLFAGAMIAFFIMVALGLWGIYHHQKNAPKPEPVPFMQQEK